MNDRFFEMSLDLLCHLDFSGRFARLNPAWERTLAKHTGTRFSHSICPSCFESEVEPGLASQEREGDPEAQIEGPDRIRLPDPSGDV